MDKNMREGGKGMGDSLFRPKPLLHGYWLAVRVMDREVGRAGALMGSRWDPIFDGIKKSPCSKYVNCLAFLAGEDGQHMAQVCQHEGPCCGTTRANNPATHRASLHPTV